MKPNLVLKRSLTVPIYGSRVHLYVSRNAARTHKRLAANGRILGTMEGNQAGTFSDDKNGFYILLELGDVTKGSVAHESRHCSDFILDHVGHKNCRHCSNEPFAYLIGYIQNWIELELTRAGIPLIVEPFSRIFNKSINRRK